MELRKEGRSGLGGVIRNGLSEKMTFQKPEWCKRAAQVGRKSCSKRWAESVSSPAGELSLGIVL